MKNNFPYIAISLGLFFSLVIFKGSQTNQDGSTLLPLLALLTICELSFFVTAAGAYISTKEIIASGFTSSTVFICVACILLAIQFLLRGITLWPS